MKIKISKLSILLASTVMSFTGPLVADSTYLQVGTGYRQDTISSSVSQRSSLNPRAKSNLHFRDIEIAFVGVKAKTSFGCCESYARASFDYGWVLDGSLKESLMLKNRSSSQQFSHGGYVEQGDFLSVILRNDLKDNGFVWDLDIGYACPINCGSENFVIAPAIGFSVDRQHLHVKNRIKISDADLSGSALERFDLENNSRKGNSKRNSWWGPWLGFDFTYTTNDCWNLYGEVEVHLGRVRQRRDANVDNSFIDHLNTTKCFWGPSFKIGGLYQLCECWYVDSSIYYSKFFSYNSRNDIRWSTANVRIDIGYTF